MISIWEISPSEQTDRDGGRERERERERGRD
jgi:hypothetical protein